MRCRLKGGWCSKPTQCGHCPSFEKAGEVEWLCVVCIHEKPSLPFYHSGLCDKCGLRSLLLRPHPISEPNLDLPSEVESREEAS